MPPEKAAVFAQANDFLRDYLSDLTHGRTRSLENYIKAYPGSEMVLPELWRALHEEASASQVAPVSDPAVQRLSVAGQRLASDPNSIAELVERALADRIAEAPVDLIEGYRLIEEIGRGGQGRVYRAHDERFDREVAIKVLPTGARPDELRRLRREGHIAARLDDPCLCKALEIGECDRGTYVVMQFVHGATLSTHIADSNTAPIDLGNPGGRSGQDAILHFIARMARALDRMHGAGVLHRDIKPGNVMVADDGRPVILDLGLARTDEDMTLTDAGTLLGTLDYMAPELLANTAGSHDPRTEVWSLGIVLFECLTGHRPFRAATRAGLSEAIQNATLPTEVLHRLPRDLRAVLETALDRDRERRYRTAGLLADDLERLQRREPVLARPIGPVLRTRRAIQRRPALAIALVSTVVLPTIWAIEANAGERRASRYLGMTLGTVEALLVQLAGVDLDDMPRGATLRRQLLEEAGTRYQRLANDDRISDEVDTRLARVEVELARLAMEQDELGTAMDYIQKARSRLARHQPSEQSDSRLHDSVWQADMRYGTLLMRLGRHAEGLAVLQTVAAAYARPPHHADRAPARMESLMQLADAQRRSGLIDDARHSLETVIAIANNLTEPAHDTIAIAWLCITELHRLRGSQSDLERALEASETAAQAAFLQMPSSRFVIGLYCLHQLYRADLRLHADDSETWIRASLTRAETLLSELGNVYPHWRQVDLMRWQFNVRNLRAVVDQDLSNIAKNIVERACTDVRAYGDQLFTSRELAQAATAMHDRMAALLPQQGDYAQLRARVEASSRQLRTKLAENHPDVDLTSLEHDAAWQTILRLSHLHRPGKSEEKEALRPSSAVARAVMSGMDQIGLRLNQNGSPEAALRQYETAHRVMANAYSYDSSRITRRFLYYAMDRHARQLMALGRWDEAIELREESLTHFLFEAKLRGEDTVRDLWQDRGPHRTTAALTLATTEVGPLIRLRFARVIAQSVQFLDQQQDNLGLFDRFAVRALMASQGKAILEAGLEAGWQPRQHPSENDLLGVLYR